MRNGDLRECLYLVKNGVPFDVAFSLDRIDRAAWAIHFAEMDGAEFDTNTMRLKDPKK